MDIDAIEIDIVRQLVGRSLRADTDLDHILNVDTGCGEKFDADETIEVRARTELECRSGIRRDYLRHGSGLIRRDSSARTRKGAQSRALDCNPGGPGLGANRKFPVYVAPAARLIVSPGWAALSAACKSPPAGRFTTAAVPI